MNQLNGQTKHDRVLELLVLNRDQWYSSHTLGKDAQVDKLGKRIAKLRATLPSGVVIEGKERRVNRRMILFYRLRFDTNAPVAAEAKP